jgi:hypothetical protein
MAQRVVEIESRPIDSGVVVWLREPVWGWVRGVA